MDSFVKTTANDFGAIMINLENVAYISIDPAVDGDYKTLIRFITGEPPLTLYVKETPEAIIRASGQSI